MLLSYFLRLNRVSPNSPIARPPIARLWCVSSERGPARAAVSRRKEKNAEHYTPRRTAGRGYRAFYRKLSTACHIELSSVRNGFGHLFRYGSLFYMFY
jgi:hypothetical protein